MIARLLFVVGTLVGVALSAPIGPALADQFMEQNTDRPGADYRDFDVEDIRVQGGFGSTADQVCRSTCEGDGNCKAWTFVKAGVQGAKARCWLKNAIPGAVASDCCISGVPQRAVEANVDRPGSDYRDFDLPAADANACRSACQAETQCQAWTYVNPGVQGASARCWLKNSVPDAFTSDCCTSGIADRLVVK
jgi:hypothetical protein